MSSNWKRNLGPSPAGLWGGLFNLSVTSLLKLTCCFCTRSEGLFTTLEISGGFLHGLKPVLLSWGIQVSELEAASCLNGFPREGALFEFRNEGCSLFRVVAWIEPGALDCSSTINNCHLEVLYLHQEMFSIFCLRGDFPVIETSIELEPATWI